MNPAAILSILVKTQGIEAAQSNLRKLDKTTEKSAGKMSGALAAAAKTAGVAMAATGVAAAAAGGKMIDLASDAEETASKFKTVFGKETKDATKTLDEFSRATGTSKFALREQAAGLQALIRPMGLNTKNASDMSVGLTKLATDLASFNNSSVQEAIVALQSGLVGESEPLRRFGVQLSAARIETFAYAEGIAKQGKDLTAAQKAQAAYGIILKDTKLAQGDATKTAGSFANQFKRLKAQVTDTATELGVKLIPIATKVINALNEFGGALREIWGTSNSLTFFGKLSKSVEALGEILQDRGGLLGTFGTGLLMARDAIQSVVGVIAGLVQGFKDGNTGAVVLVATMAGLTAAFVAFKIAMLASAAATRVMAVATGILNAVLAANPIGLIVLGLIALGTALFVAYKKSETFRDIVNGAWTAIKSVAGPVISWLVGAVTDAWEWIKTATTNVWNSIDGVVIFVLKAIKLYITTYFAIFKAVITTAWTVIKTVTTALWDWFGPYLKVIWESVKQATGIYFNAIKTVISGVWSAIKTAATVAWTLIKAAIIDPIKVAKTEIAKVWGDIKDTAEKGWARIKDGASAFATGLKNAVVGAFETAARAVVGFVNKIIDVVNKIPGVNIAKVSIGGLAQGGTYQAFARGGAFARTGGVVSSPITLMGEEAPRHPEFVIPTNPAYRKRAQGLAMQAANAVGLKEGGVFGAVTGVFDSAVKLAQGAGGFLKQLASKGAGAVTGLLPSAGSLPTWLQGVGTYAIEKVGGWIKGAISKALGSDDGGKGAPAVRLARMISRMNEIHSKGYPYVYGGGHGGFGGPYDCSGLVSAILNAGGFLGSPVTTDGLKVFGEGGDGKYVTVGVRGSTGRNAHTMMKLGDRYLESGSGHGARWVGGWSGGFPIHRHPAGFARGGIFGQFLSEMFDPARVGWGLRKGGILGSYKSGTPFVPQTGPYLLHRGEAVIPEAFAKGGVNGKKTPLQRAIEKAKKAAEKNPLQGPAAGSIKGQTDEQRQALEAAMANLPTQLDYLNAAVARAGISGDKTAALAATQEIANLRYREYQAAVATADPRDDIDAAANYKSAQDALKSLEDAIKANTEALEEQKRAYDTLMAQDYQRKYTVSQSQYQILAEAIAGVANRQIGQTLGIGLSGMRAPAGAVARS